MKREHFPIPTIEDTATRLNGTKLFRVFGSSNDYWEMELDEYSMLTTFNIQFERYMWKRMPSGISSAPDVSQRSMRENIEGLKGVEVIAGDLCLFVYGNTSAE